MSNFKVIVVLLFFIFQAIIKADDETDSRLITKLECQPAEKRVFNYESNSQLWGPLEENFIVRAKVIVYCLGKDESGKYGNNANKYIVEIKNLKPSVVKEKQNEIGGLRRSKRGVGSWFKQAWVDVKEFFVTLFSSKKRTDAERELDFDLEKQPSSIQFQCKSSKNSNRRKRSSDPKYNAIDYDRMFSIPFVFVQLMDGSIPEVQFSPSDKDITVKNFKRHIADTFATQLDATKPKVMEQSPIGAHFSRYSYDNSGKLEESLQPTPDGSTIKLGGSLASLSLLSVKSDSRPLSVMRDVTQDDVMELGNGNNVVYDRSQIGINAKQIQQISEGRLTTTAGHLSLSLIKQSKNSRSKRSINGIEDISEYMKVKTKYSLSINNNKVSKRSIDDSESLKKLKEMETKLNFKSETLVSESSSEISSREKLTQIKKYLTDLLGNEKRSTVLLKYSTDHQNSVYNTLLRALNLEKLLNEDTSDSSITKAIQHMGSENTIKDICSENLSLNNKECHDLLIILITAQSNTAQSKLIQSLNKKTKIEDKSEILKILVHTPKPSEELINQLLNIMISQTDINNKGVLMLAISNLAYHSTLVDIKNRVVDILINELTKTQCIAASDNSYLIDLLESVGNLGHNSTVPYIESIDKTCSQSDSVRIAAIHASRRMLLNENIQKWLLKLIKEPKTSCLIKQEVINVLIEEINAIQMDSSIPNRWPKIEFNEIDNVLSENLVLIKHNECFQEDIIRYFERKLDEQAKAVLKKAKKIRSKREVFNNFWTEAQCNDWSSQNDTNNDSKIGDPVVISDKLRESEDVENNNIPYRKRRKCTASKRFGPNQAQAVFRADIINDLSGAQDKPEYKLMAQFVVGTHFLGKDIDIGRMYVYHRKNSSRAYVNIFGNTLVDAARSSCDGTEIQPYINTNYFPLYDFNLWIIQVTLGIRLTGEMNFDLPNLECDSKTSSKQIINLTPEAKVRAAGEVSGKVLIMKGGMNIGGDFNYFSNLEFKPNPELCLSVYNGYNPMNVSIASWYQFWHPSCSEWMDRIVWSPKSLNWEINDYHRSAWIQNECLLRDSDTIKKRIDP